MFINVLFIICKRQVRNKVFKENHFRLSVKKKIDEVNAYLKKKIFDIVDINALKKIRVKLKEYLFTIACTYKQTCCRKGYLRNHCEK